MCHRTVFRNISFQKNITHFPDVFQCSHMITEVSTYSWFASSLNQIKNPYQALQYTYRWFENMYLCLTCHSIGLKQCYMHTF